MIWWLKARNVPAVLPALFAVHVMAILVRQEAIPVPAVAGPSGRLLVTQFLGVLPVVLLLHGLDRGDTLAEEVALRHNGRRTVALCVTFALLALVTAAGIQLLWDRPEALSLARNCAGFLGSALVVRAVLGPGIAAICVAALPLVCAAAGRRPGGSAQPWAWPIQEPLSYLGAGEAAFLLAVGCALAAWRNRPVTDPFARTT
ncbi:hypothetical protein [Streptomyces lydicus]|uniref:hypothetical protein n=1 Tax=Streptomyces lydicus TaxID=47763 RepID=UPI00101098B3|nr:hypothetical protein [Streptomyces lydicus]MCZ1006691.1 hypothetical protein [Streptomyces lydicus]